MSLVFFYAIDSCHRIPAALAWLMGLAGSFCHMAKMRSCNFNMDHQPVREEDMEYIERGV